MGSHNIAYEKTLRQAFQKATTSHPSHLARAAATLALRLDDDQLTAHVIDRFYDDCKLHHDFSSETLVSAHTFFDSHFEEINQLVLARQCEFGTPIHIEGDIKVFFASLAYNFAIVEIAKEARFIRGNIYDGYHI